MSQDVSSWREKGCHQKVREETHAHRTCILPTGWELKSKKCITKVCYMPRDLPLHWADWTYCRNLPIPPIKCGILTEPPLWCCYLAYWEQTAPSMPDFLCIISLQTPICLEFTLLQNEGCRILCFYSMVWQCWVIMPEPDGTLLSPAARASNNASGAPLEGKMTSNWDFHSMFYSP